LPMKDFGLVNGKLMLAVIIAWQDSGGIKQGFVNTSNKDYCYKWFK
jgi:hypothetical protein